MSKDNKPPDIRVFTKNDLLIGLTLTLSVFIIISLTAADYGMVWDEGFYCPPARLASSWLGEVLTFKFPFSAEKIDEYWKIRNEHPAFVFLVNGVSHGIWSSYLADLTAHRMGAALFSALLALGLYLLGTAMFSSRHGLLAVLLLFTIPRVFAHCHFAVLDIPMAAMGIWTALAFWRGMTSRKWMIAAVILFGLALNTKLNAAFIPIPLIIWALFFNRKRGSLLWLAMIIIGPLIMIMTWPWVWHDTIQRLMDYKDFHLHHQKTGVFYFGEIYRFSRSAPWHYPLVLIAFTLPIGTLALSLYGIFHLFSKKINLSKSTFIALQAGIPLLIQAYPGVPKYDGIRLFLPVIPWLALFASFGAMAIFYQLTVFMRGTLVRRRLNLYRWLIIIVIFLVSPIYQIYRLHPMELSYYNLAAGGIRGAESLGMETTYWCDSMTPEVRRDLGELIPAKARVAYMAFSGEVLTYLREQGMMAENLTYMKGPPVDYIILQCRQGFYGKAEIIALDRLERVYFKEVDNVPHLIVFKVP